MGREFQHLFTPFKIGGVTVRNRIFMPAHTHGYFSGMGEPSEVAVRYYEARAKGGIGLITTAPHYVVWPTTLDRHTAMESDNVITALKRVADAVHKYGTRVFCQLEHGGNVYTSQSLGGGSVWGPSPIPRKEPFNPAKREFPHEIDQDAIKRTVQAFGSAARRAREAGYDGVEIMAASRPLIASFLSPAFNKRTDQYGGSLENRMRILMETIDAIRDQVGRDFVVGVRFNGDEFIDDGLTLDDAKEVAKKLEATHKLDYLFPSAMWRAAHVPPMYLPPAPFVYLAAGIKEVASLPVFCVGRINDPVLAERILSDHQADMIGMMRANLCDPEMPNKARGGRLDEIRRCIACVEACNPKLYQQAVPITCALNPEAGREKEFAITRAANPKRVMVVGGGVAGLETARVAALRGHKLSLYEKENVLAKELSIAAKSPGRQDFEEPIRYYTYQMKLLGVDVHLGVTVTPDMVLKESPDAVVVATGTVPFIPDIPGSNGENVVEMRQVLQNEVEVGQNVIVADCQCHIYGLDVADFLAERGRNVELLSGAVHAGDEVNYYTLEIIYTRVLSKGVILTPLTRVKEIKGNTVIACNVLTGAERQIEGVDTIVFASDGMPNDSLYRSLKGKVKELYQVGQCVSPRKLFDSVYDGARVGRQL